MKKKWKQVICFASVFVLMFSGILLRSFAKINDYDAYTDGGTLTPEISADKWESPTEIVNIKMQEKQFVISTMTESKKENNLYFSFPKEGGVRFHGSQTGFFQPDELSVITYQADGEAITMKGGDTKIKFYAKQIPWYFEVYKHDNTKAITYKASDISFGYDKESSLTQVKISSPVEENESLFGLGERFNGLIQNGKTVEMWNYDSLGQLGKENGDYNVGYKNVPIIHSNNGYTVFHNNTYYGIADIADTNSAKYTFSFAGPILDMYIWTGTTIENIDNYCQLTGSSVTIPKYALSYWKGQGGNWWRTAAERANQSLEDFISDNLDKYDELHTPIRVVYLEDIGSTYGDGFSFTGSNENCEHYKVQTTLKNRGVKFLGWINSTYATFEQGIGIAGKSLRDVYHVLPESSVPLVKKAENHNENFETDPYKHWMIDFSNPAAKKWETALLDDFYGNGLIGVMVDYNDNHVRTSAYYPYVGKTGAEMHNLSQYYYTKTLYETFKEQYGEGNFVHIARAGVAGSQSFGAVFAGDQTSTFTGLQQSVSALLSSATSGFNVWGSDIGGLSGYAGRELFARWLEFGTFSPLMRTHGQSEMKDPWEYKTADGVNANQIFQKYYWTRENIVDLVNSGMIRASVENYPMTQSMVVAFPENKAIAKNGTQYMFCDNMLVCPVTKAGVSSLQVQFPEGRWVSIWDGKVYEGDGTGSNRTISAATEEIPVFLQAGAAFPAQMGKDLKFGSINTEDKNTEALVITPATKQKINTVYKDKDTKETIICDVANGTYRVSADQEIFQ